eukprot:2500510-Amphidinium_carterae.1
MSPEAPLPDSFTSGRFGAKFLSKGLLIGQPRRAVSFCGNVCVSKSAGHSASPATTGVSERRA